MQQSSNSTAHRSPARRTRSPRTARAPGLLRDQRGITTAEYAMVFVVVAVGSLATWKSLANKVTNQVSASTDTFNTVLSQHVADATKGKGDGHADALGVGAFKQPEGHTGGAAVGKNDERHLDGPAANGGSAMYKGDERGGQVQGSSAPVHKGDQRAEQAAQAPTDRHKGDERAEQAQPATDVHKGDQRAEQIQQAQAPAEPVHKGDQHAEQAAQAPAEGLHKQDQTLAQDEPTNKQFQDKRDAEPHYSTATNKQQQTKMDPAGEVRKGDTRALDQSNNKPKQSTPVKGGGR